MIASQQRRGVTAPTSPFPDALPRPRATELWLTSISHPLALHVAASGVRASEAQQALEALESAYDLLDLYNWPLPPGDGGRGATAGFDVYLAQGEWNAASFVELPLSAAPLDGATVYGRLAPGLDEATRSACAVALLAEAAIASQDPAEPPPMRRASAELASWQLAGAACQGDAIAAQRYPEVGLAPELEAGVAAGAMLLGVVAERHDGGSGRFVREVWQLARQKSEQPLLLRVEPTFLQALDRALHNAGERLDDAAVELATARYFTGPRRGASPYLTLTALPDAAVVPVLEAPTHARLPKHLPPSETPLRSYGSSYVRVPTPAAGEGAQLKVWLRGEPGARWALSALRFDAQGRELGRIHAPPRRVARAYLPIELDAHTASVLLIVLKLPLDGSQLPAPELDDHHYQLILGR